MQESPECSIDAHTMTSDENGPLRPVAPGDFGEGFPYAPDAWPNPGDKWAWKAGCQESPSGYWQERYLYPPEHLNKAMVFQNKTSVKKYIEKEFPNANVDAFFSSFNWRIPCIEHGQAEATQQHDRKRLRRADSSKDKVSKQRKPPYHESKQIKFNAEMFSPETMSRFDLPHPNDPGVDETIDRKETDPKISGSITIPVNSVVGCATCETEKPSSILPISQVQVAAMKMEATFPDIIQQCLTSAVQQLTEKLKLTPLEFLGDRMVYFHDHIAWFVHFKFPIEEFKQDLNRLFSKYQEKVTRRREIEVQLREIEEEIVELDRIVTELHIEAVKLQSENRSLFL